MRITSGSGVIDRLLNGGYETDVITTIYGPAGSGKTNLCLLAGISVAKSGKKVIYIDTEGSFSVERLKQIDETSESLKHFIFMRPTNFDEQKRVFSRLKDANFENVGLIIIDSMAMLYRLEKGKVSEVYDINRELGLLLGILTEIARKEEVPVLLTNQVYASFEDKDKVMMVGGDLFKYGSKCLIELKSLANQRMAVLRKHRSIAEGKRAIFRIVDKGIEDLEPPEERPIKDKNDDIDEIIEVKV